MSLVKILASKVTRTTQSRGWEYYRHKAVTIIGASEDSIDAEVLGTDLYLINLTLHDDHIHCSCTCPRYLDTYGVCKHIWATLIAAEARSLMARWKVGPSVDLIFDDFSDSDDLDDVDDGLSADDQSEDYVDDYIRPGGRPVKKTPRSTWKQHFDSLRLSMLSAERQQEPSWRPGKEILYIIDAQQSHAAGELFINTATREPKKNGWKQIRPEGISHSQIARLPDPLDRQILLQLLGAPRSLGYYSYEAIPTCFRISDQLFATLIPLICSSGRCRLRLAPHESNETELRPLQWDNGEPWQFWVEVRPDEGGKQYTVKGGLRRGDERMDVCQPLVLFKQGILLTRDSIARVDILDAFQWITLLRETGSFALPAKQMDAWFKELLCIPYLPRLDLPEELCFEEVTAVAEPQLRLKTEKQFWGPAMLKGGLSFVYEGIEVAENEPGHGVPDPERRRRIVRDRAAENAAAERMKQVGFRKDNYAGSQWQLATTKLPQAIRNLVREGWRVEAEGKLFRRPGSLQIQVNSGVDWFELRGTVQFDDREAPLPALLAALKRGHTSVELGDGTFGILPEEWLKKYGMLAGLGTPAEDHLRFSRSQVGILDALLAAQPEATCDAVFARAREQIRGFGGIEALDPPAGFSGQLRGYQRDGLGWLHFVRQFGFGGCLADDMGLGKTVQVLALLEARREMRASDEAAADRPAPSLVVVPKSLVFNWKQEAARFAPGLRVLEHTGGDRTKESEHFENYDVILTTYGTLRRDAPHFKDVQFDYVILDEAQAIKNANTESAKAARLLRGQHRLALSGTPVQNHLGELWSLFEFLNPGMLGSASVFRLGEGELRKPDEHARGLLAAALRPFILRRTKEQVAKDLPQKLEQTLYCELEPVQRKLYDELREHYRRSLLGRIDAEGIAKSKLHILEALLRLRQAACHPGLIDKTRIGDPSAKVDMLLPRLAEVRAEGHKALVFSQFTSFLAIVRQRLEQEKIPYEYLDGQTRDRASPVEKFQTDPESKLFLISLKAGGLGLNLTAAEYVFLLDPWWNPAVEAQAIDRTHRIGQTRNVFAYRLIAQGTVEEKVLELQQTKQHLAEAIINADNSLIRELRREDLELLLS